LNMSGMSGKQTMQQIRALEITIPILICSGYSEQEAFKDFFGLDIAGFMQKPFTARQLANRVSTILNPGPSTSSYFPT
jgi:DNA-binding response OmpR family regulator